MYSDAAKMMSLLMVKALSSNLAARSSSPMTCNTFQTINQHGDECSNAKSYTHAPYILADMDRW